MRTIADDFTVVSSIKRYSVAGLLPYRWMLYEPLKLLRYWWHLVDSILTMDNLWNHKIVIINACPPCLAGAEFIDHLLNHKVFQMLWRLILGWFDCSWVLPNCLCQII